MSAGAERVHRLLAIARRIASPDDALGAEARARLRRVSGLSAEGVELALREHLEIAASDAEIQALVTSVEPAPRCWVVLAANVCTAPLRAIACGLACAREVRVRPSRRDPVLAELLVSALGDDGVTLVPSLAAEAGDAVHAYGSDESIAAIARELPAGTHLTGHGSGFGVAVIDRATVLEEAAEALADDLVPFDGGGCLSPRLVLVDASDRGERFFELAHQALTARGRAVPRGPLTAAEHAELARYRSLAQSLGSWREAEHHGIAFDPEPAALALPPALRVTLVLPGRLEALEPWFRFVTAIGCAGEGSLAMALAERCPGARRTVLGRMQKPPFDGPVDLRRGAR